MLVGKSWQGLWSRRCRHGVRGPAGAAWDTRAGRQQRVTRREKGRQLRRPVPAPVTPADIPAAPLLGPRPLGTAARPANPMAPSAPPPDPEGLGAGAPAGHLVVTPGPGQDPRCQASSGPTASFPPPRTRELRRSGTTKDGRKPEEPRDRARSLRGDPARPQGTRPRACETWARPVTKGPFAVWTAEDRTLLASCPACLPACPALTSAASAPQRLAAQRCAHAPPTPSPVFRKRVVQGPGGCAPRTACSPRAWLRLC